MKPSVEQSFGRHSGTIINSIAAFWIAVTIAVTLAFAGVPGSGTSAGFLGKKSEPEATGEPFAAVVKDFAAEPEPLVVTPGDATASSVATSKALLSKADSVIVVDDSVPQSLEMAFANAKELKLPVLVTTNESLSVAVSQELNRLGAKNILTVGQVPDVAGKNMIVLPVSGGIPEQARKVSPKALNPLDPDATPVVMTEPDWSDEASMAIAASIGAKVVADVADGDPRTSDALIETVKAATKAPIIAIGSAFGDTAVLAQRLETARKGATLPGGGQVVFPYRKVIALYGTPGTSNLGLLGEQDAAATVKRAREYAAQYQALTDEKVVPGFEIITTVASGSAGEDGDFSHEIDSSVIKPWIEAAQEAGIMVMLDLQPGRTSFLKQAKMYEDLLLYPNVGLALDPEWRLKPNQRHLRQIGSVDAAEVNQVHDWLSELVLENHLPQKIFILHQFRNSMIKNREDIKISNDQLAVTIHVDGQGPAGAKINTWNTIRKDAPEVFWGWKNFIDEDIPMLTPKQTYDRVDPLPDLVTYQ